MVTGRPVLTCKVVPSKIEKLEFCVILNAEIIYRRMCRSFFIVPILYLISFYPIGQTDYIIKHEQIFFDQFIIDIISVIIVL